MKNKLIHAPDNLSHLKFICGLDEVGRGSFAGPVVTASVILPSDFSHELIRDSKLLTEKQRLTAYDIIIENAIAYSIQAGNVKLIDEININEATFNTMHKCLDNLTISPEHLLIDGNQWKNWNNIPHTCVVKGDNKYLSIASASILAKVKRDEYMSRVHEIHPEYNFVNNKGYFCKKHGQALLENGSCRYHRKKYVDTWLSKQNLK